MSLREAGRHLQMDPTLVHGIALGLGIGVHQAGRSLVIARKDLVRIRRAARRREQAAVTTATATTV